MNLKKNLNSSQRLTNSAHILAREIGRIEKERSYHFFSDGRWSIHELIEYLLEITGPADVMLSTFSVSEVAVRSLVMLRKGGKITNLKCLFDKDLPRRKLDLMFFASKVIDRISLMKNHSKVITIKNDNWMIAVNTSANLTPNLRIEAGVITTESHMAEMYIQKMSDLIEKGLPYEFIT